MISKVKFTSQNEKLLKQINGVNHNNMKLLTFKYMLPFRIPVSNGEIFIDDKNKTLVKVLNTTGKIEYGNRLPIPFEEKRSIVECTTIIDKHSFKKVCKSTIEAENEISSIFNIQLSIINHFIRIIMVKFQYHNVFPISKGDIQSIPLYRPCEIIDGKCEKFETKAFIIKWPDKILEDQSKNLSKKELGIIFANWENYKNMSSMLPSEKMRMGERYFYKEDYNNSIIYYQTALETFIYNFVYNYYKIYEKLDDETTEKKLSSYKNVVYHHFIPKMKELQVYNSGNIEVCINNYFDNYYYMRNDIVHRGEKYDKFSAENFTNIVSDIVKLVTYGMGYSIENNFTQYFNKNYIISDHVDIEEILSRYESI
ncbi:hypothetical protein BUY85_11710 [Staphylococcus equorum]|uniref:hypothetical protein n=1 Tax=Staphylococcus equorum TaxID=246432 RepID=UPI000D1C81D1|nr:hypothetical protein [Staphylococcus equorum]PTE76431.1 hypothetical protein BUY85_11710 [Staphylococcus equorum]